MESWALWSEGPLSHHWGRHNGEGVSTGGQDTDAHPRGGTISATERVAGGLGEACRAERKGFSSRESSRQS